jgi:hypothetical protein
MTVGLTNSQSENVQRFCDWNFRSFLNGSGLHEGTYLRCDMLYLEVCIAHEHRPGSGCSKLKAWCTMNQLR